MVRPDAGENLPKLVRAYGGPFADPSAIPSFYLAEMARQHVTVALNGDGGDESFAGYGRYLSNTVVDRLAWLPAGLRRSAPRIARLIGAGPRVNGTRSRIQRMSRAMAMEPPERYAMWMSAF